MRPLASRVGRAPRGQVLLTVREAAELLRVRPVTVYRLCARGALPHSRVSNAIRIHAQDLDRLLHRGES